MELTTLDDRLVDVDDEVEVDVAVFESELVSDSVDNVDERDDERLDDDRPLERPNDDDRLEILDFLSLLLESLIFCLMAADAPLRCVLWPLVLLSDGPDDDLLNFFGFLFASFFAASEFFPETVGDLACLTGFVLLWD